MNICIDLKDAFKTFNVSFIKMILFMYLFFVFEGNGLMKLRLSVNVFKMVPQKLFKAHGTLA